MKVNSLQKISLNIRQKLYLHGWFLCLTFVFNYFETLMNADSTLIYADFSFYVFFKTLINADFTLIYADFLRLSF